MWNTISAILSCVSLSAVLLPAMSGEPDDRRAFTIEDLYRVVVPSGIDVAPDGGTLVYSLRSYDLPRGKSGRDLYAIDATGGETRRLTWTHDADESSPAFSPDGKTLVFLAKRRDQSAPQLWLMPTHGGEARPLTSFSTGVADPVWSPDGRRIAFTSEVHPECGADDGCNATRDRLRAGGPLNAHVADDLLYRHWTAWSDGKVSHVLTVEIETGEVRDLTPGIRPAPVFSMGAGPGYTISRAGGELCFTRNGDAPETLSWSTNSDLWVVARPSVQDDATPEAVNLTAANPAWDSAPRYSPGGRKLAYLAQDRPGFESDLVRLMVLDRATGEIRHVNAGFRNRVDNFAWMPDGESILYLADVEGTTPLYVVPAGGGTPRRVAEFGHIDEFVPSPDGRHVYAVRRTVGMPAEIWRLDLTADRPPLRLTRHNRSLEQEVDIRPAERLWIDVGDGRRVQTFLVKPHGFDPSKKYPLILNVHGGPQMQWTDSFRGDWQVYPGAGYIVAYSNPSGSTGYGQEFTDEISRDWGGRVFEDLMKVTDHLVALPYVDPERIGAMGWSFGGFMMNWFQGHTDRFAALADMMGLFDLRSFYLTTEELWFPEWDLGGTPWDSELYERWNPAASIAEFSTPMLVITGELDYRVPYTQGLMAFTALRRRGVPSRLIVLPEAGHWPAWYEMALYHTAHLDWFRLWLGGGPPPWSVEDFVGNAVFDRKSGKRIDGDRASRGE